jgi:hypothetical protein
VNPPVWLLSTKGRPAAAQETLDACERTGMRSRGFVYVDADSYPFLRLPDNWTKFESREHLGLQGSMQWCFKHFPRASSYGWLADDNVPQTPGWDALVEEAAGDWNLAYCKDHWVSNFDLYSLERGGNLGGAVCWGGELMRLAGWWAAPGLFQGGIDLVWTVLLSGYPRTRYLEDVVVLHKNWKSGARHQDSTDTLNDVSADVGRAYAFMESERFRNLRAKIARLP